MKTGNVSSASDMALVIAGMNAQQITCSQTTGKSDSFGIIMERKTSEEMIPEFGGTSDIGHSLRNSVKPDKKNDVKQIIRPDTERVKVTETAEPDMKKAAGAVNEILSTVADELGISEDELSEKLSELGFTVADIVMPQNMAVLIADVNGTDVTAIVTDPELGQKLSKLTGMVSEIVSSYASELEMVPEDFTELMAMYSENDVTAGMSDAESPQLQEKDDMKTDASDNPATEVTTVVVKDEATGHEVEVTFESSTNETVETKTVGNIEQTPQNSGQSADSESGRQNDTEHTAQNAAQSIVENLTGNVTESIGETSFDSNGNVGGTDVISQILEAVRVNASEEITSMEIQLTPEHLGKVNLTVTASKEGILTASIVTQNEAVRAAVESQIFQLKDALNNQGLKIQEVQVTVAGHGFDMNDGMQNRSDDDRRQHAGRRRFRTDAELGLSEEDITGDTERTMMKINGNSVSYTA